jgi:hypothetical protein
MRIGVYTLFARQSDGGLNLITCHPLDCGTWHWSMSVSPSRVFRRWWLISRDTRRTGQWHDYYRLPFGRSLTVSHQDYHAEQRE